MEEALPHVFKANETLPQRHSKQSLNITSFINITKKLIQECPKLIDKISLGQTHTTAIFYLK